jgi:hypothetical protein
VIAVTNCRVSLNAGVSSLTAYLLASQEELCSMELVLVWYGTTNVLTNLLPAPSWQVSTLLTPTKIITLNLDVILPS